ncbi:hypothetical protein HHI36_019530 [Cryptolaemus montrouzieri]|uniref:Uncharacterized protein n=1 Tax=Cryptolaemus montrouzieri TaxID=559131 RepID=A0ABD2P3Y6_9CUCU
MGEDTSSIQRQEEPSRKIKHKNESSQSLLSIVHDKNKTIEKLQKQLHFQKLQLKYYLGKTFDDQKMIELSKTCSSQVTEENLPVTLAVNRFYRQMGFKSRIINLYDRMCNIDGRISNMLQIQECFLKKVISKICDMVRKGNRVDIQFNLRRLTLNSEYMEMFNNLLNANIGLKKNLDTFRICCDRLIIIEEERNMIVEQVFSLPIEERTNCNYLIGIQMEKIQLQNKMKQILKDQQLLRNRIDELSLVETQFRKLQEEYKIAYRSSTEHVTGMLKKVNNEALSLIAKSNQQREKYTKEIVKLKNENMKISKLLESLKISIKEREPNKDSLKLDVVYSAGLFQALDKEITQVIRENELNKDSIVQNVRTDCRELSQNLQEALNQNSLLIKEYDLIKTEYNEAKRQWAQERMLIKREKDDYKAQVEDLQAIRTAYAQLVESRVDINVNEVLSQEKIERQKYKLDGLEQENDKLSLEVAELKEESNKQKSKIKQLSNIIMNLNGNDPRAPRYAQLYTNDVSSGDLQKEDLPKTNSCIVCKKKSELEKDIILQELDKSNVSTRDIEKLVKDKQLDEITTNIIQNLSNTSDVCHCGSLAPPPIESSRGPNYYYSEKNFVEMSSQEPSANTGNIIFEVPDDRATTFEIQTSHRNGKKDTIKGILEGRNKIDGTLKMGDTSLLSVRFRCVSPGRSRNSNDACIVAENEVEHNEYELLKDCSLETISHTLPPVKKSDPYETHRINLKELSYVSNKRDSRPLTITYKNIEDCKTTTSESDPTTNESQGSEVEYYTKMEVQKVKTRLRALAGLLDSGDINPVVEGDCDELRIKNTSQMH